MPKPDEPPRKSPDIVRPERFAWRAGDFEIERAPDARPEPDDKPTGRRKAK